MRRILLGLASALIVTAIATPTSAQTRTPELRPFVGAYIPTGAQRDLFRNATMVGVQGAMEMTPTFHLLGTVSWTPVHNKYVGFDENVNLFTYDVGAEVGLVRSLGSDWLLKPFGGLGIGMRSYSFKGAGLSDETCGSGYVAMGSELQLRKLALRLEGRDNVFCYRSPLAGVASKTRNDVGLAFGRAYHFR